MEAVRARSASQATHSGPHHRRKAAKHARQTPRRHHGHTLCDDLAPGDLGAMNGHDWHHHHAAGVDQDLGVLVRLAVHRAQGGASG